MSTSTTFDLPHDRDCSCETCESMLPIKRYLEDWNKLDELTKPETMAKREDPLLDAFELSKKIADLNVIIKKKSVQEFGDKCMSFTAGLCDECRDQNEIAALYNFDEELLNDLTPKRRKNVAETLKKAVDARHKEVEIYIFFNFRPSMV